MAPYKKDLTPLTKKGGVVHKHAGKGSQQAALPDRQEIAALAAPGATMNNYAKATPMAMPQEEDGDSTLALGGGGGILGSGTYTGGS